MTSSRSSFAQRLLLSPLLVLYVSVAYFLLIALVRPEIATGRNLMNLLLSMLPLVALAIGQTFVLAGGGIDLSLTAVVSLCSVVGASILSENGGAMAGSPWAILVAVGAMLLVGLMIGAVHGISVAIFRMPPFLVTLSSLIFFGGLTTWVTQSKPIGNLPESYLSLGYGHWYSIPKSVVVVGALAILAAIVLRQTVFGKELVAIGLGPKTARVSGVPVRRTLIISYLLCGGATAVAAMLYMARLETGKPALVKDDVLLDCIGAAVIGGASLMGGRGTILGVVLGALFITLVANSLNLFSSLQIWHILMIKGFVILLAALLDATRTRFTRS